MSGSGAILRRGGRAPGSEGYLTSDVNALLECIEAVLPRGGNEWDQVLVHYREQHAEPNGRSMRDVGSLKSKFRQLLNAHKPTGDPACPPEVKRAHVARRLIEERVQFQVLDDSAARGATEDAAAECVVRVASNRATTAAPSPSAGGQDPSSSPARFEESNTAGAASQDTVVLCDDSESDAATDRAVESTGHPEWQHGHGHELTPTNQDPVPSIRIDAARLRPAAMASPPLSKRPRSTPPKNAWEQHLAAQATHREARSIERFQSSRILSLEQEVMMLKHETLALRRDLIQAQKSAEEHKDKNYALREDALQQKALIIGHEAEIAALKASIGSNAANASD